MAETYKQIKDYQLKNDIDGTEDMLIQDNSVTKRIKTNELKGDKGNINLSNYYTKSEVDNLLSNVDVQVDIADYYSKSQIDSLLSQKVNNEHNHDYNDLNNKQIIPTKISQLTNDSNFAVQPNFTFEINMIGANDTPSVITTGIYPNLTITFNIPQYTDISDNVDVVIPLDNIKEYNNVPYLSTYYVKPTIKPNENLELEFYVSDYQDKAYTENNNEYKYKVIITREGKEDIVLYDLEAGNHKVDLGSFDVEGEYEYSIIARDQYGRFSHELFNYVRVANERVYNVYQVTEQDLIDYNIKYDVDREIKMMVDCSDIFEQYTDSNERVAKMKERTAETTKNYNLPSGKYIVAIPDRDGDGIYKGKNKDGFKYQSVRYADDYDKIAVEEECNNTRLGIQRLLDDKMAEGYDKVIMHKAVYSINANVAEDGGYNKDQGICVPNGMSLDLNGATLKLNPCIGNTSIMLYIMDSTDTHVYNGIIEGDYFAHDYANSTKNSEWVNGIEIAGKSKYCSMHDLIVRDITGYGVQNGLSKRSSLSFVDYQIRNTGTFTIGIDIDQKTGEEIENPYRSTSVFQSLFADGKFRKYTSCSRYLGYQDNGCGTWNIIMHFYDKNKKYIKSVNGYQYRRIRVPENGYYVRTTILNAISPADLSYQYFNLPTHCEFKNIKVDNARCVGVAPAQMKDFLFDNIEVNNSGQSGANCALDAEDGWDGMQDATYRAMKFRDNPSNDWLVCAGHNFIIEDSPEINVIYAQGRCRGLVVRNSKANNIHVENKGLIATFNIRLYNFESKKFNIGDFTIKDCKQSISGNLLGTVKNCDITILNGGTINGAKLIDSTVTIDSCTGYLNNVDCMNVCFREINNNNIKFNMNYGEKNINIATFNDCKFYNHTTLSSNSAYRNGLLNNCEFKDGVKLEFFVVNENGLSSYTGQHYNNCKFNNIGDKMMKLSPFPYSFGKVDIHFNNCEFNFNESAEQLIDGYSCPINGSVIEFKDCVFAGAENMVGFSSFHKLTTEGLDITFIFDNCIGLNVSNFINNADNKNGQVKIIVK